MRNPMASRAVRRRRKSFWICWNEFSSSMKFAVISCESERTAWSSSELVAFSRSTVCRSAWPAVAAAMDLTDGVGQRLGVDVSLTR